MAEAASIVQEHDKIKNTFAVATLISTIAGTFLTGINLYDRINEQRRQKKLDRGQNRKLKELEARVNEAEAEKKRAQENGSSNPAQRNSDSRDRDGDRDRSRDRSRDRDRDRDRYRDYSRDRNDDLRRSLEHGGPVVQREYDRYFASLGSRFAQGDLVAQTQLQSQVIILQGDIIRLLEHALLNGGTVDMNKLYNTSEFARKGSLRALRDQYQRLLQAAPIARRPGAPIRRISSTPALRDAASSVASSVSGDRDRAALVPAGRPTSIARRGGPLFCPVAKELQRSSRDPPAECGACGAIVGAAAEAHKWSWRIDKEVEVPVRGRRREEEDDDGPEDMRTYLVTPRFVAKCHREGSGYACYLCFRFRDNDTVCDTEDRLVTHVANRHGIREYEGDPDIVRREGRVAYRS